MAKKTVVKLTKKEAVVDYDILDPKALKRNLAIRYKEIVNRFKIVSKAARNPFVKGNLELLRACADLYTADFRHEFDEFKEKFCGTKFVTLESLKEDECITTNLCVAIGALDMCFVELQDQVDKIECIKNNIRIKYNFDSEPVSEAVQLLINIGGSYGWILDNCNYAIDIYKSVLAQFIK